ncbi:hypothetical protein JN11_03943 [Mucilaginibacter frigoritolerans]|uniref:Uncharacterized protein n=1 Tax=Mucilaginibacter frigoritolerans TaxID=652788 RepID=A0A562TVI3_9SPHI|nr:hypothetical protein [Mucilaginibacter frigoritolerans]TWI96830.1 hypothetical protein JN11_03943 [Mucilaginibacter frigoritolerans]
MERTIEQGTAVQNSTPKPTTNKTPQQNGAKKDSVNGITEAKQLPPPAPEPKNGASPEQPKVPEPEEVPQAIVPMLTLESTLKAVDDLHRKSIQRINLISRIKQLESFEVVLSQEHDELDENPYQGCKLIIEDDKQRRFITTTPGLIRLVSQFIFNACNEKLLEIEARIVFPKG